MDGDDDDDDQSSSCTNSDENDSDSSDYSTSEDGAEDSDYCVPARRSQYKPIKMEPVTSFGDSDDDFQDDRQKRNGRRRMVEEENICVDTSIPSSIPEVRMYDFNRFTVLAPDQAAIESPTQVIIYPLIFSVIFPSSTCFDLLDL